jgi:hypothetical protein
MAKKNTTPQEVGPPPRQSPTYKQPMTRLQGLERQVQDNLTHLPGSHLHRYVFKEGMQSGRGISLCHMCSAVGEWGKLPKEYTEGKLQLRGHWLEGVNRIGETTGPRWLQLPEDTGGEHD